MPKDAKNMGKNSDCEINDRNLFPELKDDPATEKIKTQLQKWAHEGTKKSLKKLNNFINKKENKDLRWYAEMARDEAELFYYEPKTGEEEKDFLLAGMALADEENIADLEIKIEKVKFESKKLGLEREIYDELMKKSSAQEREEWKYRFAEYYVTADNFGLAGLKEDLIYYQKLAKVTRSLIKTEKYSNIPIRALRNIKLDFEGASFGDDEGCQDHCCDKKDINIEDIPF